MLTLNQQKLQALAQNDVTTLQTLNQALAFDTMAKYYQPMANGILQLVDLSMINAVDVVVDDAKKQFNLHVTWAVDEASTTTMGVNFLLNLNADRLEITMTYADDQVEDLGVLKVIDLNGDFTNTVPLLLDQMVHDLSSFLAV